MKSLIIEGTLPLMGLFSQARDMTPLRSELAMSSKRRAFSSSES